MMRPGRRAGGRPPRGDRAAAVMLYSLATRPAGRASATAQARMALEN